MNNLIAYKDNKEMENKKKIWLGWLAFSFVIFHFGTIFITTFPENYTSPIAQKLSNYYVTPLFSQTWNMFTPCPLTQNTLKFKLYFDDDTTQLIVPSTDYFKYHSIFRFTHHGDLAVGESNLLFWIQLDLDELNIEPNRKLLHNQKDAFYKTRGYFLLKNYLSGYATNLRQQQPKSADVYLEYYNVVEQKLNTYTFLNLK